MRGPLLKLKRNAGFCLSVATVILSAGCASNHDRSQPSEIKKKSTLARLDNQVVLTGVAERLGVQNFTEIDFKPGSAELSSSAKATLRSLLIQAQGMGSIEDIIVASWSDHEYPAVVRALSAEQRELAQRRGQSVRTYLESLANVDVATHNMAERPQGLSRWFNTKESDLKNSLVLAGIPTTADNPQYPSKSSQAVILVKVK